MTVPESQAHTHTARLDQVASHVCDLFVFILKAGEKYTKPPSIRSTIETESFNTE